MHNRVKTINPPGKTITHHAFVKRALFASDNILPHEITSTGKPKPKKLKVDSNIIQLLIFATTINIMVEIKLGSKCL